MATITNNTNNAIDVFSFDSGHQRVDAGSGLQVNIIPANTTVSLDNLDEATKNDAVSELSILSKLMNPGELDLVTDIDEVEKQVTHSRSVDDGDVSGYLNNWNPFNPSTPIDYDTVIVNPTRNTYLTGIIAPSKATRLVIINRSPDRSLYLNSNDYRSASNNRFLLRGTIRIEKNECIEVFYDISISKWRAITNS